MAHLFLQRPGRCMAMAGFLVALLAGCTPKTFPPNPPSDTPYIVVLGVAQDAGAPQAGSTPDHAGWTDLSARRHTACLGLVDPVSGQRWMFEATPDFKYQLHHLDQWAAPTGRAPALDGIFLTHAHIGHYAGLIHVGHEVMGAAGVPVYAMPRMRDFLQNNGPWDQLVRYENIVLRPLAADSTVALNDRLRVTPLQVPHRDEYAETVGFRIEGPSQKVLFLPDINKWEIWEAQGTRIEDEIARVDVAYVDATFYDNGEVRGRDMAEFPHPFIVESMARFAALPATERAKIHFIHLNHTNPALDPTSAARQAIEAAGFRVAEEGGHVTL